MTRTLEFRCALEPVRRYGDQVVSYQAWCDKLDLEKKRLECLPSVGSSDKAILERKAIDKAPKEISEAPGVAPPVSSYPGLKPFTLSYDKLVIAVGGEYSSRLCRAAADIPAQPIVKRSIPQVSKSMLTSSRMSRMLVASEVEFSKVSFVRRGGFGRADISPDQSSSSPLSRR